MIRLELNDRVRVAAPPAKPIPFPYGGPILDRHYMPSRGLLYSFLVHEVVLFGLLFLFGPAIVRSQPAPRISWIDLKKPLVLYLPNLNGGEAGESPREKKPEAARKAPTVAANPSRKGLIYPGPQPIRSDFPNPTNRIQTVLRPTLKNLPVLPPPLKLPNIVQMASVAPPPPLLPPPPVAKAPTPAKAPEPPPPPPPKLQPQIKPIEARVDLVASVPAFPPKTMPRLVVPPAPEAQLPLPNTVDAPKITGLLRPVNPFTPVEPARPVELPLPDTVDAPKIVELARPIGPVRAVEPSRPVELPLPNTVDAPKIVELSRPTGPARAVEPSKPVELPLPNTVDAPRLTDLSRSTAPGRPVNLPKTPEAVEPLLALSPTPAPPDEAVKIPAGEARGRFAIGPDSNLTGTDTAAGAKDTTSSSTVGIADRRASATGNAGPANAAGSSNPGGGNPGAGDVKDNTASGTGKGAATATGAGGVTGTGAADGSAPGRGAGSGRNAFPGITIVGGNNNGATTGRGAGPVTPDKPPAPPRTSYGVSIVTSGSTGGGLPSMGVFTNEQVYTAYLDMKWANGAAAPSWTFEYAVIPKTAAPAGPNTPARNNEMKLPTQGQQGLVLPFPMVKEQPVLSAEVVRKYLRRVVIVYAVLNADGKMEQMVVKQSPDAQLNEPVINALSKWTFRPAQFNGENVSVKVLLGFPLALSE